MYYFSNSIVFIKLPLTLHLLERIKMPLFPQMFHMSPICWSITHSDNPANWLLSVPYAKQSELSPELLIHLCCITPYIWDQLFVAFEASRWADGTWDPVRSHEFAMCSVSPAPARCWAQTTADVIECTFVNIYPGRKPVRNWGWRTVHGDADGVADIGLCVGLCFQSRGSRWKGAAVMQHIPISQERLGGNLNPNYRRRSLGLL